MTRKNFLLGLIISLSCLNFLAWTTVFEVSQPSFLEVVFFDVGQGDAIFIKTPQKHQILIDGGPDSRILERLSQEMPFYDRSLDLVILTHPEKDHMGGLIEVLEKYRVDYILWPGILRDTSSFQEWQDALQKEEAQIKIAKAGQRIIASEVVFDILHPFESLEGKKFKDSNNTSVVAKLSFGRNSFLFTGDIYQSVEKQLIREYSSINSDVLKIAHHGSKTSSSEEFLETVSPEIAVILVGKNSYGHPHQQVLERIEKCGIEIMRTDERGDIKILSDGNHLTI